MEQRAETVIFDQNGRELGARAIRTRQRLLEATEKLLASRSVRDVSVVDITREAGTSPAAFYQYFKDVTEAVLRLAEHVSEQLPHALEGVGDEWSGTAGLENARKLVRAFFQTWDEHRTVLLARNLIADDGDVRFHRARRTAASPVVSRLARQVREAQRQGWLDAEMNPIATAMALVAMVERLATYNQQLDRVGLAREELIETCARLIRQTVAPA